MTSPTPTVGPGIKLNRLQKTLLIFAAVVLVATVVFGPYLAAAQAQHNGTQLAEVQASLKNTKAIVQFIHQVQTSPAASASRDSAAWDVQMLTQICKKLPGCVAVPLPPDVAAQLPAATVP